MWLGYSHFFAGDLSRNQALMRGYRLCVYDPPVHLLRRLLQMIARVQRSSLKDHVHRAFGLRILRAPLYNESSPKKISHTHLDLAFVHFART